MVMREALHLRGLSPAGCCPGRGGAAGGDAGWDPEAVTTEPGLAFSSREELPGPGGPGKGCSWGCGRAWECAGWGCGHWSVVESGLELTEGWAGWGARFQGEAQQCAGRRTPRPGPTPDAYNWHLPSPPLLASCPQLLWTEVLWGGRAVSGPPRLRSTAAPSIARHCPLGHPSQGSSSPRQPAEGRWAGRASGHLGASCLRVSIWAVGEDGLIALGLALCPGRAVISGKTGLLSEHSFTSRSLSLSGLQFPSQ